MGTECLRLNLDFLYLQKQINPHALYLERVPDGLLAQVGVDGHHGDGLLEGTLGCDHPLGPAQRE
jgi:hypothetical protein